MLSIKKITHNNSKDKFEFVPNLDMTIKWSDSDLYKRYDLDSNLIEFIEKSITDMN
jgi:hypothetical protein